MKTKIKLSLFLFPIILTGKLFSQIVFRDTAVTISQSSYSFSMAMNGNLDAENTFSWDTIPNTFTIKYQPMVSLTVSNTGNSVVNYPRLVVNDRKKWFDLNSINNEATDSSSGFTGAAKSIWNFVRNNRFHRFPVAIGNWGDPVKLLGIYGFGICGNISALITELAGNEMTNFYLLTNYGHTVSEFKTGNDVAVLDGDMETFYLKTDNYSLASITEVANDRHLIRRSPHYGRQYSFSPFTNKLIASLYRPEPQTTPYSQLASPSPAYSGYTLDFRLRPGESITYEWKDAEYNYTDWGNNCTSSELANGKFFYRTNFTNAPLQILTNGISNVIIGGSNPNIHADTLGKASLVVKISSPFTIVNGIIKGWFYKAAANDSIELLFSKDSVNWTSIAVIAGTGNLYDSIPIYNYIQPIYSGAPTFYYYLKFVLTPTTTNLGCGIDSLEVQTTFQVSRFFLPGLKLGINSIEYSDLNNDSNLVQINFKWQESTQNTPPAIIMNPVYPADGGTTDSLKFTFIWPAALDADGDTINNYEFELGDSSGFDFPLSPVFNVYTNAKPYYAHSYWEPYLDTSAKVIAGKQQPIEITPTYDIIQKSKMQANQMRMTQVAFPGFTIPEDGLLNAGQMYYWRVRARDSNGAWGEWSPVWSFTPDGVMPPVNCSTLITEDTITLTWEHNPSGVVPSYYEIHKSNEGLGFSPDTSTFWDTTSNEDYSFILMGNSVPGIFYRIIAVSADGQKSGVSDLISLPYPYLFRKPDAVIPDSIFTLDLSAATLWFPYYNNTLYVGIAIDTIYPALLYLPGWIQYDSSNNRLTGLTDSSLVRQMVYDTLLSAIILKLQTAASFPHSYPPNINQIPSKQNIQTIRLRSNYVNNKPFHSFADTSFIMATNYFEQTVTGYDNDTIYGDSVTTQFITIPPWVTGNYLTSSSIKLTGIPGITDTGDFMIIIRSCDRLNECMTDTLFMPVRFPWLNIPSDSITLCEGDALLLTTQDYPGYDYQWFKDTLPIMGATDDTLPVTEAGIYKVRMNTGGQMAFSTPLSVFIDSTHPLIQIFSDTLLVNTVGISYQWFFQGIMIAAANQQMYVADSNGSYFVELLLPNGCMVFSDTVVILVTSSPNSYHNDGITVSYSYGNHTVILTLNGSSDGEMELMIFDINGALVNKTGFLKSGARYSLLLDMNNFANGLYLLELNNSRGTILKKIIKLSSE